MLALTIAKDGGWRGEDGGEVSASGAVELLTACDLAFPVLHGVNGEDGAIAGFLELTGVPYVGSPVGAGAVGMDKWVTKLVAGSLGIATARARVVGRGAADDPSTPGLEPPFVVKPAAGGSSDGVSVVPDRDGVAAAVATARGFGSTVLIEEYVRGREVDVAVFRDRDGAVRLGATLEIGVPRGGVFGRRQKYDGSAVFTLPAPLDPHDEQAIRRCAVLLYDALGCRGVARFDFFVTAAGVVLNEVNTSPGMTERSQVPLMFAAVGLDYVALVAALLATAEPAPSRSASA